jgi:hypothetical protein
VDTSTHHLSAFGHHVTIGTGFPIYEGGEEGLLPSVNILRFHRSTLASTIQTTFTKVSTDLIPAAPLWLRDTCRAPGATLRNVAWSCQIDYLSHPIHVMTRSRIVHGPTSVEQRIRAEEIHRRHYLQPVHPFRVKSLDTLAP